MQARVVILLLVLGLGPAAADPGDRTLVGQVTCSNCWFEADRNRVPYGTESDMACAARCAKEGIPAALAVKGEQGFDLLALPGAPPEGGTWLEWIGRYVRVEGNVSGRGTETASLAVATIEALPENPWRTTPTAEPGEIAWTDLLGHPVSLEHFAGRVTVVNFWATWCRPCAKEMPDLVKVRRKFAPYGVTFVGAAADATEHGAAVLDFARRHKVDFQLALGATTAQMESLGLAPVLPGTVVLDAEGNVTARFPGVVEREQLELAVAAALGLHHDDHAAAEAGGAEHEHDHGPVAVAAARPRPQTQASLVPS